ncbi:MAG: UvrD-helicase domain-containing protein [Puniceicoccales bacterium]|jgi:ATP-dependent exoDNAse (exonuclease V) beta subunit|nr:UvrD-helicase domain-containing protein [Puniceicoccales bacterium]
MTTPISSEVILASAGSGKTYQLSNRIIRLLASGAAPSSILALTFTRKAAGEFARRTLTKLASAAVSESEASRLAGELQLPGWDSEQFGMLLWRTVHALHRLRLGTLDSFYQNLVRAYFFELGLSGSFALLDERDTAAVRRRVMQKIFRRDNAGSTAQQDFLEAFRLATWGREERGIYYLLESFIEESFDLYQSFNDADSWGSPDRIFSGTPCPWFPIPGKADFVRALNSLNISLQETIFPEKRLGSALLKFIADASSWQPGQPVSDLGNFLVNTLLPNHRAILHGGSVVITYYRKENEIPPAITGALADVLRYIVGGTLERLLRVTKGVYSLLRQYDDTYDQLVRRRGQLTFSDISEILADSEQHANIGFRLDGITKHWLFDEFQDTSRRDWKVLEDNVDAVLTDESGERSAFFVGDVKQALYGWRGGDHTLLPNLCEHYLLTPTPMDTTYRSSPAVLELVNAVFNNLHRAATALPGPAIQEWQKVWHSHAAAGAARDRPGYTAWWACEKKPSETESAENRLSAVVALLARIRPIARGLTCGILVQKNEEARVAADFLRTKGIRVVSEADMLIAEDNPVIPALLALFGTAAHPGDSYNAGLVAMVPALASWIKESGGTTAVRRKLLESIATGGFEKTLLLIGHELGQSLPHDPFSTRRWEQLITLSLEFDATGSRNIDDFVRFIQKSTRRDTGDESSVQVMTIHKSKGLEFDVVFLPFLEGSRLDSVRKGAFIQSNPPDHPYDAWVLSTPDKTICENTPGLAENLQSRQDKACYEKFCLLYVALTRARHATLVLTTLPSGKSESGMNFHQLFSATLCDNDTPPEAAQLSEHGPQVCQLWESGEADWFTRLPPRQADLDPSPPASLPAVETLPPRKTVRHQRPSDIP